MQGGQPMAVFYPLGHPTLYAYGEKEEGMIESHSSGGGLPFVIRIKGGVLRLAASLTMVSLHVTSHHVSTCGL
jgi:hypothetical protein